MPSVDSLPGRLLIAVPVLWALVGCAGDADPPAPDAPPAAGAPPGSVPPGSGPDASLDRTIAVRDPGAERTTLAGAPSVSEAWRSEAACSVSRDGVDDTASQPSVAAAGNGRAHFRLADGCTLEQTLSHRVEAGEAISVVFDTALASGSAATLIVTLGSLDENGAPVFLAERRVTIRAGSPGWRSDQLLSGFSDLDAHAGRPLVLRFRHGSDGGGVLGLDAIAVTGHRDDLDAGERFLDTWSGGCDERWTGEHFFANRLRDWAVLDGRLITSDPVSFRPLRTVHRVSSEVRAAPLDFRLGVNTGILAGDGAGGWSGFLVGAGHRLDHRGAALVHNRAGRNGGLLAGIDGQGRAFLADNGIDARRLAEGASSSASSAQGAALSLNARFIGEGRYRLEVDVRTASGDLLSSASATVPAARVLGNLALAAGPGRDDSSHWFDDFSGRGAKLAERPARDFGPVLFASHTLSRGTLTLNAQYPPTCAERFEVPVLQAETAAGWQDVATATIDPDAFTARFSVPDWRAEVDTPYRVRTVATVGGEIREYTGVVRADPVDQDEYVLGLFNCRPGVILSEAEGWIQQFNGKPFTWTRERIVMPHEQLLANAAAHEPDLVAFVGDQIYEFDPNGLIDKNAGLEALIEDYLWKWFQFGWSVRELMRDTPTFIIPDDHDVYQGNVWGQGGRAAGSEAEGGFVLPAAFVRIVQRTQTGSLPDPFDPTPVDQGIEVYYTDLVHGGVGTAVIEDRKFKTGPGSDAPKRLLGDRQLTFLDAWARDWSGQDLKMVVSQSPFAQSTTHSGAQSRVNGFDRDSNGWPSAGRDLAVAALRRARAPHIAGDQHLGMTLQHGIRAQNDAVYGFAGPSMLNIFPRIFDPGNTGLVDGDEVLLDGPGDRARDYRGPYVDPHGNRIDVKAAANPQTYYSPPPPGLSARADALGIGYGIVRLERSTRRYTFEAWPADADPRDPLARPYPDWPITIEQGDNDGRLPAGYLPSRIAPVDEPIVEVVNESSGVLEYAVRAADPSLVLPVHDADATYRVTLSEPASGYLEVFEGQRAVRR